ncbi:hypothetical protein BT96DRAFT_814085, partial [Gymnopus androsaceus JB14]
WEDPEAMGAVFKLAPVLLHLRDITVAFFRGSLSIWTRFSSEFAPAGLIDLATAEEKYLAWMPATNDVNEGLLGCYRVTMQGKPTLMLHQFNALVMYQRNDTLAFMDALFNENDHQYIWKMAREIDSSGLEAKQRAAQVAFHKKVVEMNLAKEEARTQKAREHVESAL